MANFNQNPRPCNLNKVGVVRGKARNISVGSGLRYVGASSDQGVRFGNRAKVKYGNFASDTVRFGQTRNQKQQPQQQQPQQQQQQQPRPNQFNQNQILGRNRNEIGFVGGTVENIEVVGGEFEGEKHHGPLEYGDDVTLKFEDFCCEDIVIGPVVQYAQQQPQMAVELPQMFGEDEIE